VVACGYGDLELPGSKDQHGDRFNLRIGKVSGVGLHSMNWLWQSGH
jgi:hypothetical protein